MHVVLFKLMDPHTGDDDEGGDGDDDAEKLPSCFDYVMHYLSLFWKILFAFVPPTGLFLLIMFVSHDDSLCHSHRLRRRLALFRL